MANYDVGRWAAFCKGVVAKMKSTVNLILVGM